MSVSQQTIKNSILPVQMQSTQNAVTSKVYPNTYTGVKIIPGQNGHGINPNTKLTPVVIPTGFY